MTLRFVPGMGGEEVFIDGQKLCQLNTTTGCFTSPSFLPPIDRIYVELKDVYAIAKKLKEIKPNSVNDTVCTRFSENADGTWSIYVNNNQLGRIDPQLGFYVHSSHVRGHVVIGYNDLKLIGEKIKEATGIKSKP